MSIIFDLPLIGPILELLIGTIAPFLVVISIVIFVHEMGHYLVGRWCGIGAEAFSIGFGRELYGWTDKRGTRWRLALLPLGGYVKFKGDADPASATASDEVHEMTPEEKRATLPGAPLWAKALTIIAGPAANFLLTIVIIFFLTLATGVSSTEPVVGQVFEKGVAEKAGLRSGDRIVSIDGEKIESFQELELALNDATKSVSDLVIERNGSEMRLTAPLGLPTKLGNVVYGGPADLACIVKGDEIKAVDGGSIVSFQQLRERVEGSSGAPLALTILRGTETVETVLTPKATDTMDPETRLPTRQYRIGVGPESGFGLAPELRAAGFGDALGAGVYMPYLVGKQTFTYIGAWIFGDADGSQLNSLIGIANTSGRAASLGITSFIHLIALISAAIGLMNLLPIPVLDGGHLLIYGIQAVRGKPVGERWLNAATAFGLVAVLMLMVFATVNDLTPWFSKVTSSGC